MKVLVIGSGAREHTLVKACLASKIVQQTIAAPGNGGIEQEIPCFQVNVNDVDGLVQLAQNEGVNFVIVGPEVPLSLGVVDALEAIGIPTYGPNQKAAQLETSKAFSKNFLKKYNLPTAKGECFSDLDQALAYLKSQKTPIVLKASGLAAGKGVIIAQSHKEAQQALKAMLKDSQFGDAGSTVLIEEYLTGPEVSITAIVCGETYSLLPTSQDHKRIGENDTGPNTGGMGAYAPVNIVTPKIHQEILDTTLLPTLHGLTQEGIHFKGTLYVGIMLTPEGPKILEFNTRFGDPETQVLFPLLANDPIETLYACAQGKLKDKPISIKKGYAITVVQSAEGYPETPTKGDQIHLPKKLPENTAIIHAGTELKNGILQTSGGRVLNLVAIAPTLEEAAEKVYALCESVKFRGQYYRRDIGAKQLTPKPTVSISNIRTTQH